MLQGPVGFVLGTDNQEKDEKQSQNDKTGPGMEKIVKDKAKSKPESQSSQKVNRKVNWSKSKSTPGPKSKKYNTNDSTRGTESGEERFKKFANNSGVVGGERFRFNPF
ncbi:hypothetical protein Tco_0588516 [Tanacetum coccineum]